MGTSFSCVAAFNASSGDPYVFKDLKGRSTVASVVGFKGTSSSNLEILTGESAKQLGNEGSGPIVFDAKRFIGRT